jgi:hypothetical protein
MGVHRFHARFTDHGGELGVFLYFQNHGASLKARTSNIAIPVAHLVYGSYSFNWKKHYVYVAKIVGPGCAATDAVNSKCRQHFSSVTTQR